MFCLLILIVTGCRVIGPVPVATMAERTSRAGLVQGGGVSVCFRVVSLMVGLGNLRLGENEGQVPFNFFSFSLTAVLIMITFKCFILV